MELVYAIGFGLAALVFIAIAFILIQKNAYISGVIFGFLDILSMSIALHYWLIALAQSGKSITWFGFRMYPMVGGICVLSLAMGAFSMINGIASVIKHRHKSG